MVKRREFLKQTAAAGIVLSSGMLIGACSGLTRGDLPDGIPATGNISMLDPTTRNILYHASLAPSGHNSQPWRVRIEASDTWTIRADTDRRLPCVDPDNRELLLSLGAFVENLCLTAGAMGRDTDVRILASDRHDPDVVRITLKKSARTGYPLRKIRLRRTVKHGLSTKEITSRNVGMLSHLIGGGLLYFPRGTPHANCIRDAALESFHKQAGRDDAQRELVKWLRLSDTDAKRYRDGLTTEGMEIRGFKGWYVRHFVSPEDFLTQRFRRQGAAITSQLAKEGGGWIVITSPTDAVPDLVETGRRFQRMALVAREHGIGIHPMTQTLEEETGRDIIAGNHQHRFFAQFILRVGYRNDYPEPVSLRRPVEWFVAA